MQYHFRSILAVDDQDVMQAVKEWTGSQDKVLRDLSERFLYRRPFKSVETTYRPDISEIAREVADKQGYKETEYCVFLDTPSTVPYYYYTVSEGEEDEKPHILALALSVGRYVEISTVSAAVRSMAGQTISKVRVYVPDEVCRENPTHSPVFRELIAKMSQYGPRTLELMATVLFLLKILAEDVLEAIDSLKPEREYSEAEVNEAIAFFV
jgi:HD superfamily phosphohydrolase